MEKPLETLVESLLYEGYALYPYTPTATKNATPTPFGIVYPPAYAEESPATFDHLRVDCVLHVAEGAEVSGTVRFLQTAGDRHEGEARIARGPADASRRPRRRRRRPGVRVRGRAADRGPHPPARRRGGRRARPGAHVRPQLDARRGRGRDDARRGAQGKPDLHPRRDRDHRRVASPRRSSAPARPAKRWPRATASTPSPSLPTPTTARFWARRSSCPTIRLSRPTAWGTSSTTPRSRRPCSST